MRKNSLLTVAAFLLFVLGVYMIYLGTKANILPPTITGVGFIIIAAVFWKLR
jgi:drug/metabolite transporter (DMT)-like permease